MSSKSGPAFAVEHDKAALQKAMDITGEVPEPKGLDPRRLGLAIAKTVTASIVPAMKAQSDRITELEVKVQELDARLEHLWAKNNENPSGS